MQINDESDSIKINQIDTNFNLRIDTFLEFLGNGKSWTRWGIQSSGDYLGTPEFIGQSLRLCAS